MHSDVLPIVRSQVTSGGLPLSALRQTSGRRGVLFVHTTVHTHMFTLYHRVHGSRNKRVIAVIFRLLCLSNIPKHIFFCTNIALSNYSEDQDGPSNLLLKSCTKMISFFAMLQAGQPAGLQNGQNCSTSALAICFPHNLSESFA